MDSWVWWIPAGITSVGVGGFGIIALAMSYWEDLHQRRERRLRVTRGR